MIYKAIGVVEAVLGIAAVNSCWISGVMTGASVVVWGNFGFAGWGEGILGSGVVVRTGGLVVRGTVLATVLVITIGTVVVRT